MKANEAPYKIYVHVRANKELGTTWHGKKITNSDIEYTRTDAFVEKAVGWLTLQDEMVGISFQEDFIERFKTYIKNL